MNETLPLVAIVGRPNVGKSALFNRLTSSRDALVEDLPGTTRDRHYSVFEWRGRHLRIVDTGGYLLEDEEDPFSPLIRAGVERALTEASLVLFVVDAVDGVLSADEEIADLLRRSEVPVLLIANKVDVSAGALGVGELHALGIGAPVEISAHHGLGIGDLMDTIVERAGGAAERSEPGQLRIAIVGRPNVGKSSLANAILGDDVTIVSEVPGTTRDAIDTPFHFEGHDLVLIDTAGIRRRGRVERGVERHSVRRAERAVDRADVVFLLVDQSEPLTAQDTHIAGYVQKRGNGLVLVVSKWDLAEDRDERHRLARRIDYRYRFVGWAPIQFTSAVSGEGIGDLLELAIHIAEVRQRRVQTSELNRVVRRAVAEHAPATVRHKRLKVMYVTQAEVEPPTFVFFVNDPSIVHFSYRRYLENQIRAAFDFEGTGIRLVFRKRSEDRFEESA